MLGGQVCGGLRGARVLRTRAPPRGGRYFIIKAGFLSKLSFIILYFYIKL